MLYFTKKRAGGACSMQVAVRAGHAIDSVKTNPEKAKAHDGFQRLDV